MTFTQIQAKLLRSVRSVRRVYRRADTAGEKLERELDRLIKRKQLLQPDDLGTCIKYYDEFVKRVNDVDKALTDATIVLITPVVA